MSRRSAQISNTVIFLFQLRTRSVGETSAQSQYILYYCGNVAVTFKAKASIAVYRVRVSPGASPAFDFREIYSTISSSSRGNEPYKKIKEKETEEKNKKRDGEETRLTAEIRGQCGRSSCQRKIRPARAIRKSRDVID